MSLATLLLAATAAGSPLALPPHLHATRVTAVPAVDGSLDDEAWKLATPADGFTQKVPNDGAAASDETVVRVVYDDDAIYVAFDCPQPTTPIVERLTRRDRVVESDSVTFALGTRGDHKSAFEFYVNASGVLADAIRFNDTDYSSDWDENWLARTQVTGRGWTAEFRIPLRILRFKSSPLQSWDFQARRYISLRQETDEWAYTPRTVGGEVSHYGRLDDLTGLHERSPFELRPFVVGRLQRRDAVGGQLASGTDVTGSAGIDLKWHPTQDLTLDATFNPDFAQVEADQVVLNLTTFETYYPEKRPFFLEGIDTFATPFQLLYTRRIGRAASSPSLRPDPALNEQLVDVPGPATIYGASKVTGRLGDKWSIGTVQALTARSDVEVQLADGSRVRRLVDPTTAFNVLRVKRDLGDNAHVALLATATTHAEPTASYPLVAPDATSPSATELCPSGIQRAPSSRCFNDAFTGGVDWRWRSPGGDYTTGGQVVGSVLHGGPDRYVADGTVLHPGDVGAGMKAYFNKEGGKHWIGGADADLESNKLDFNDLGYNQRANQIAGHAWLEHRELEPTGAFLENHFSSSFATTYNAGGLLIGQGLYVQDFGRFKNFWNYYTDLHYRGTKYDDREVGDGTALQRAGRFGHEIYLGSDPTKRVNVSVDQVTDVIYDGFSMQGSLSLSVRALPQLDIDLLPNWQWTTGEPRFVADGPANGQYIFGEQDAKSIGVTMRTTYTFAPRLTLQGYAQLFLASGHYSKLTQYQSDPNGPRPTVRVSDLTPYAAPLASNPDFEQGVLNVNLVLRWEYTLGSTLFLVYTRAQAPTTTLDPTDVGRLNLAAVGRAPASDALLLKVTYWWGG